MGNIRSKTDGSVTHLYTYGNSQWADLLTAYDGHTITYDGSGSPLIYYNGADYTFTWEQGRQLASVTKGNKTASYTYDMSGVRSSKTVNGVSYEYTTLSGKITRMTWSGNAVDIVYDDAGRPYLLRYTPSGGATQTYYYVLNLQGDVVGLMNTSMQMVVKYSYDPWGKLTGTTATSAYVALAQANPLRYRSYCYDIETGFYYLQTRYYDPTIARFINADGYLSTGATGLLSHNMFAYCENNPVMYSDIGGSVRNYCVMEADNGTPGVVEAVAREAESSDHSQAEYPEVLIDAFLYSLEFHVGFGMGLKGSFEIGDIGVNAGYSKNLAEAFYEKGNCGVRQAERYGLILDVALYEMGYEKSSYNDFNFNDLPSPEEWEGMKLNFPDTVFEAELYVYIGGSIRVGVNWDAFYNYVKEHS